MAQFTNAIPSFVKRYPGATFLTTITLALGVIFTIIASSNNNAHISEGKTQDGRLVYYDTGSGSRTQSGMLTINLTKNLTLTPILLTGSSATFLEIQTKNTSNQVNASTDFVAGNDISTSTKDFVDLGINSSKNADAAFTINAARDAYLYASDGNLAIGTASGKALQFFTNGTLAANERVRITSAGSFGIGTTAPSAKLTVVGTMSGQQLTVNPPSAGTGYLMMGGAVKGSAFCLYNNNGTQIKVTVNNAGNGFAFNTPRAGECAQ